MKRPSLQFYPADWRNNAKLRRCSFAERGVWIDVICLLHDSDEYGVLRWPLKDIALAVGCKPADLKSLVTKGVFKGGDGQIEPLIYVPRHANKDGEPVTLIGAQPGPVWYSSRMVRDEYIRSKRGENTRFESPNPTPKHSPKPPNGEEPKGAPTQREGDGASSASSSSSAKSSAALAGTEILDQATKQAAAWMREAGLKGVSDGDPRIATLAREGVTKVIIDEAVIVARSRPGKGDGKPIYFSYAAGIITDLLHPTERKTPDAWWLDDAKTMAKAQELGVATIGKGKGQLQQDIHEAIAKRKADVSRDTGASA